MENNFERVVISGVIPYCNMEIGTSLSHRTKCFLEEIGQDAQSMYNILECVALLLEGQITEDDFLAQFYSKYRTGKTNYMNGV